MFWLACEELKRETDPDAVEEKARFIYEDYISILSPKEVSAPPPPPRTPRPLPAPPLTARRRVAGVAGLAGARGGQPQHGGTDAAHVRRGAAADLHADAPRLVPALRQLPALQDAGAAVDRGAGRCARAPARDCARTCARARALARARARARARALAVTGGASPRHPHLPTCK